MTEMRALSCKQPWAEMLLASKKDVETRPRNTSHRGTFLIHASKQYDWDAMDHYGYLESDLSTGALLGVLNLKEVLTYSNVQEWIRDKNWHKCWWIPEAKEFPKYGYVMTPDRIRFEKPISHKGQLGFWKVPNIEQTVKESLEAGA